MTTSIRAYLPLREAALAQVAPHQSLHAWFELQCRILFVAWTDFV